MRKHRTWTPEHIKLLEADLHLILRQSGKNRISQHCAAVLSLAKVLDRSTMAVSLKARSLAINKGLIKTRKQAEQEQKQTRMVMIPLEKLYGKVDFKTFMTLINE